MDEIRGWTQVALGIGLESQQMEFWQMALRAVIVYAVTLAMVRLGKKRFMGKATAFDVILGIVLGSIVSRAITGNAPLVPSLAATATLIALHSVLDGGGVPLARLRRNDKGCPRVIVGDGRKDEAAMRIAHLTDRDLEEDLHRHGMTSIEGISPRHDLSVTAISANQIKIESRRSSPSRSLTACTLCASSSRNGRSRGSICRSKFFQPDRGKAIKQVPGQPKPSRQRSAAHRHHQRGTRDGGDVRFASSSLLTDW